MQIRKFRNDEFVNREKEIEYLKKKFEKIPKEILWLYGPKSTGKTTLIEYIIEKELLKEFHKMLNSLKNFNFCLDFWGKIKIYQKFDNVDLVLALT